MLVRFIPRGTTRSLPIRRVFSEKHEVKVRSIRTGGVIRVGEEKKRRVFISNLPYDINKEEVGEFFKSAGTITRISLFQDEDRKLTGSGYVEFESISSVDVAINAFNMMPLKDRKLLVRRDVLPEEERQVYGQAMSSWQSMWKRNYLPLENSKPEKTLPTQDPVDRSRNVFIGNLPATLTESELRVHMCMSRLTILDAIIFRRANGTSKCCGMVTYKNPEDVQLAIDYLHGTELNGRSILVKRDEPESERGYYDNVNRNEHAEVDPKTTLFVTNIGWDVNVQQLQKHFESVGEISSLTLFEGKNGTHRGRAIVQYKDPETAATALLKLDGVPFESRTLFIRYCNPR